MQNPTKIPKVITRTKSHSLYILTSTLIFWPPFNRAGGMSFSGQNGCLVIFSIVSLVLTKLGLKNGSSWWFSWVANSSWWHYRSRRVWKRSWIVGAPLQPGFEDLDNWCRSLQCQLLDSHWSFWRLTFLFPLCTLNAIMTWIKCKSLCIIYGFNFVFCACCFFRPCTPFPILSSLCLLCCL